MKKSIVLLFGIILLLGIVSAGITFDKNYGERGGYEIKNNFFQRLLGNDDISNANLIHNTDTCLVDCSFTLEYWNENPHNVFDDINFINNKGKDVKSSIKDLTFEIGQYELVEKTNYSSPIYSEIEEYYEYNLNYPNIEEHYYYPIIDYDKYYEEELVWREYNGEEVQGYFQLRANAKKNPTDTIDWIITFRGHKLTQWAWWNGDYPYRAELNLTSNVGNFSYLKDIPYKENMEDDFSDVCFIYEDSGNFIQLNHTIQTFNSGSNATVRVNNLGEDKLYMYWGSGSPCSSNDAQNLYYQAQGYLSMDEVSGTALDLIKYNNATVGAGVSRGLDTLVGRGYQGSGGSTSTLSSPDYSGYSSSDEITLGFYANITSNTHQDYLIKGTTSSTKRNYFVRFDHNMIYFNFYAGGWREYSILMSSYYNKLTPYVITFNQDNQNIKFYIDGELKDTRSTAYIPQINSLNMNWFADDSAGSSVFLIDEMFMSNTTWSDKEVQAWSNHTAPTYIIGEQQHAGTISIDYVTPPTPENGSNLSTPYIPVEIEINYTKATLENITYNFYKDGVLNASYFYNNETLFVNHTGCTCANWQFNVTACYTEDIGSTSNCVSTETRQVIIDVLPPEINITSPLIQYDYLIDNQTLDLNFTVEDDIAGVDSCWYEYVFPQVQYKESYLFMEEYWFSPEKLVDEDWDTFGYYSLALATGELLLNYTKTSEHHVIKFRLGNYNITKNIPSACLIGEEIEIKVRQSSFFGERSISCKNSTDWETIYNVNADDFFYEFGILDGFSSDLNCSENTTFNYITSNNNITIYANDTFGNIGNITRSWDVDLTYLGMDYQNETISTTSNPFSVKYAYDTNKFTGTMAYLNYSGTSYLMNSTANNSEITANKDLIIATSLPINYTFGFKVELARVGQSPITYSINNFTQLVKPIDLSLCNATQTSKYIQYNIFKEGTTTPLNASFEWTGSLWIDGDGTISQPFSYKDESENKSTFSFCTNYTEQNITTTGLVSYLRSDSDRRDYVLTNLLMTNQSQTINLFLLPINQSSIVTITLYDYNNNYIANGKINVLRWDIGTNTFSTVATLTTNQDGRTFVNLDLFNSYYKFVVTYQGRVILTTDPDRIGSTEISLRASLGSPSDYEPFRHITRDMTYNKNTHVVNFVWSDNSGAMARGCLVVYKNTPIGRQQVSRECSTSVSSILSYLATDNQTSYTAIGTIFLSSAYNSVYDDIVLNFEFGESIPSEIVGTKGYVLSFLLFGFIISATMATGMVMITAIGLPVAAWFVNMMGFLIIPNYIFITITSLSLLLIIMEAFKKK